jgi:NADPH:quinone reductase-like Zn-dependent oxidoreductase
MRALPVTRNGSPGAVLDVVDVDLPEPGSGPVGVGAASLNFTELVSQ